MREIIVDSDWFDRLEEYLHADERFTNKFSNELILFTFHEKKLIFKREEK